MKKSALLFLIIVSTTLFAQQTKRVLFLGNSYTGVNNLPQMVADVALSLGDTLIFDSNTPGGFTLNGHTTNAASQSKIAIGTWDYVVLQEQSQLPAFPYSQFSTASLPYSITLSQQIRAANSCTKPLFYMTWGRKNGDQANCASYPPLCTYGGMQGQLRERYLLMGDTNNASVSPVGAVWREVRSNFPNIELYSLDESHPSLAGSYLAACTFYASIFKKSPVGAGFPGSINLQDAQAIQQQANQTVFDSLSVWMIDTLKPMPSFVYTDLGPNGSQTACDFEFDAATSLNVDSVYWDFGDGSGGSGFLVQHSYQAQGTYSVTLEGWKDCDSASFGATIMVGCFMDVEENKLDGIKIYPNPTKDKLRMSQFGQGVANGNYKIFDLTGKLILKGENSGEINVSKLPAGSYLLRLIINDKSTNQLFVKE